MTNSENVIPEGKSGENIPGLINFHLTTQAFTQLSGSMAGFPFVKFLVDKEEDKIHFINDAVYHYHADYIAEQCLHIPREEVRKQIDRYNKEFYLTDDRRFFLGIVSLHTRKYGQFFALETVEIDNMNEEMVRYFFNYIREFLEPSIRLFFKPANHEQEELIDKIPKEELPRILSHELFATAPFVSLNAGEAKGRIRIFNGKEDYRSQRDSIEWYDIIVMDKVPDDIPRVAGILNSQHTTPLSHTNVLAHGWQIPNAIQIGHLEELKTKGMNFSWVHYVVDPKSDVIKFETIERPPETHEVPKWCAQRVTLDEPDTERAPICSLSKIRATDHHKYGTKAANLGELFHILTHGSGRLTGYYRIPRPPRENLLPYLRSILNVNEDADVRAEAEKFLRENVKIPRGVAIPFSVQQRFLESSPKIQQGIGKLKMALELDAKEIAPLCIKLQTLIKETKLSDELRDAIDSEISMELGGVKSFVIRSSSNAEDLKDFSAAGIYESVNHVTSADNIFKSIKKVWASLISPRSVRLRQQVGISLDDCYMGVIIQEEVPSEIGGVMVTTNPLNRQDIRNVYINVSTESVENVVSGKGLPMQYVYNTLEGGGNTISLGDATEDLDPGKKQTIQKLAIAGRLLQSHFSSDYTFETPADIEWAINGNSISIFQLRPYAS